MFSVKCNSQNPLPTIFLNLHLVLKNFQVRLQLQAHDLNADLITTSFTGSILFMYSYQPSGLHIVRYQLSLDNQSIHIICYNLESLLLLL